MNWRAKALVDNSDKLYAEVAKSHARRNCLVIGPAGSGTLSLVRGLAALTNSRARKFLFDWEVEPEAQRKLMADLFARLESGISDQEVWIHRKIHSLVDNELNKLIQALRSLQDSQPRPVVCYATAEPNLLLGHDSVELEELFTVRINLGQGGYVRGALNSILTCSLELLRRKYGRAVTSIDPEGIRYLEDVASRETLPAMFAALERAYVVETGTAVQISTLMDVQRGVYHSKA